MQLEETVSMLRFRCTASAVISTFLKKQENKKGGMASGLSSAVGLETHWMGKQDKGSKRETQQRSAFFSVLRLVPVWLAD